MFARELHGRAGENHALLVGGVVGSLPARWPGDVLAGHVRTRPVAVVVVDVQRDMVLGESSESVQVYLAEGVDLIVVSTGTKRRPSAIEKRNVFWWRSSSPR